MADETRFEQEEVQPQAPQEIEIEELDDESLEDVAGGDNSGCTVTINKAVAC